ncbi:hypothetical protein LLE49_27950 [Alicyclobacillus tolerans]|uniref:DUF6573 family protein n=1 Tax=Alicyclobacillus tolerans TaxID=90970 RepID=UPI001F1AD392|nr:DUF6573 family protein [Alicyclobacillus tolerans]MCF8568557.1 hypothetical protein [Alicyclobacillus tolerans]
MDWSNADVIHTYTRDQALEDEVLINVTNLAKETGVCLPVAVTAKLWHEYIVPSEADEAQGQDTNGRLWDVLYLFAISARRTNGSMLRYDVGFLVNGQHQVVRLKALIGPGDNWEPVITIMLSNED